MNATLRRLPDGSGRSGTLQLWFETAHVTVRGDTSRGRARGEVYWPFAVHWTCDPREGWQVTHLPSGYDIYGQHRTRAKALALVQALRALPVDWSFTQPKGRKWEAAKALVVPCLRKRKLWPTGAA